jgi:hypothetical protein
MRQFPYYNRIGEKFHEKAAAVFSNSGVGECSMSIFKRLAGSKKVDHGQLFLDFLSASIVELAHSQEVINERAPYAGNQGTEKKRDAKGDHGRS